LIRKNEKTITNKMLKFIQETDKDNQKPRLRLQELKLINKQSH